MFVLASASPRRKELLKKIVSEFEILAANIDERAIDSLVAPEDLPVEESKLKARAVVPLRPNDDILAVDTIVLLDGKVLGKPLDKEDAVRMLLEEAGKRQTVISGFTYIHNGIEINGKDSTEVYFNELSEKEIREYVKKYMPLDKAGAYGIQDEAGLIKKIEGSYDNVMGLPTERIRDVLFPED